jgi:hypothetical protein
LDSPVRSEGALARRQRRRHRPSTFGRHRKLGVLIRAFGDIFRFADAAAVSAMTAYRWAARSSKPKARHAAHVNALARARDCSEPFVIGDRCRFRERGKAGKIIRALIRDHGGLAAFARAAGASENTVRAWARDPDANPLAHHRECVNALARQVGFAEPFSQARVVHLSLSRSKGRVRSRGPLAALVRACGGVAGLAREARVGDASVYRWINDGPAPWRDVALRVNRLARTRGLVPPFDAAVCPKRGEGCALDGKELERARSLVHDPRNATRDVANALGVSSSTVYRWRQLFRARVPLSTVEPLSLRAQASPVLPITSER